MPPFRRCLPLLAALLLTLVFVGGCDNTIEPFSEKGIFSVYGALTLSPDRQFVRVKALNAPLLPESTRTIDATVTLENLASGTSTTLRDSIIPFGDTYTHNFWTDDAVEPDTEYRITVERSDGATTRATTVTPAIPAVTPAPTRGNCITSFEVTWTPMPQLRQLAVWIGFQYNGSTYWIPETGIGRGPGHSARIRFVPEPVLAEIIPSQDNPDSRFRLEPRCLVLDSDEIYIAYRQFGPEWFGDLPEDALTYDPTESRFIDGGLGFFGSLRRDTISVTVDTSEVIELSP